MYTIKKTEEKSNVTRKSVFTFQNLEGRVSISTILGFLLPVVAVSHCFTPLVMAIDFHMTAITVWINYWDKNLRWLIGHFSVEWYWQKKKKKDKMPIPSLLYSAVFCPPQPLVSERCDNVYECEKLYGRSSASDSEFWHQGWQNTHICWTLTQTNLLSLSH